VFARRQVLHRNQILATGVSGPELTELVALGVVTRLWRGFYTLGDPIGLPDPRGVTRSMRAVLSHESAAAWWGVDLVEPVGILHVTAPRNRGRRADDAPGVRIHRADLAPEEIRSIRGVRVTSPIRTALDIARSTPLATSVAVGDGFLRRLLATQAELAARVQSLPRGPGRRSAARLVELADPQAGSVFESITRVLLIEAGLPSPVSQYTIRSNAGRWIGRVDFAWPEAKLVLECDGFEHHSSRDAFIRDRRRWNELVRAGWRVVVVSWADVVDSPSYVVDLIAEHLATAA
jgi:hypothetical protein